VDFTSPIFGNSIYPPNGYDRNNSLKSTSIRLLSSARGWQQALTNKIALLNIEQINALNHLIQN